MLKLWGAIPLKFDDAPFFIYIVIMALKRDRVNRVNGLVYLPIDGQKFYKGKTVTLVHTRENDIDCYIRDSMAMKEPKNGDAIGDAIFDAMLVDSNNPNMCDAALPYGTGCIVLHKILNGIGFDLDMQFLVKVSLNGGTFMEYQLKAGQSITLDNIADSTSYEVIEELTPEQISDGYSLDGIEHESGIVHRSGIANVTIHNKYERPQFFGNLVIVANVSGVNFDLDKIFKIVVQFNEPVNYSVNGGEPISTASKIYIARLKHGQSVTLSHIIAGATYNVVAVPLSLQDIESGYEISSVTGGDGTIVRDTTETSVVNYTYYGSTGSLVVTAIVDNPESNKALHIAITFSRVINYSVNGGLPLENGSSVYMAELQHNESVTIADIPNGVAYAVTPSITESEVASGYSPNTDDGAYPRRGTMLSKNSPVQVYVKFAKSNQ